MYSLIANNERHAVFAIAMLIVILLFLIILNNLTVFEDGSYILGIGRGIVSGCIPWRLCGVGG
jgi:hypothetical protein